MAAGVSVHATSGGKLASRLQNMRPNMQRELDRSIAVATANLHRAVLREVFGGKLRRDGLFLTSAPGNQLANRTGRSRQRINSAVFRRGISVFGVVGSPDKHVLANELGATISARSGGALTIPTKNVLTSTGALKGEWSGVRLRDVWKARKLFVLGSKGRTGFVARHVGSVYRDPRTGRMKRRAELLFLLRKTVNLAARHMFRTLARKETPNLVATVRGGVTVAVTRG